MDFAAMCMGEGFLPELLRRTKANEECAAPSIAHSCMHPWKPDDACAVVRRLASMFLQGLSGRLVLDGRSLLDVVAGKWSRKGGRSTPTTSELDGIMAAMASDKQRLYVELVISVSAQQQHPSNAMCLSNIRHAHMFGASTWHSDVLCAWLAAPAADKLRGDGGGGTPCCAASAAASVSGPRRAR